MRRLLISAAVIAAIAPAAATASTGEPSLEARAILPADATWTGQPVGGFSALLDAGRGRYWAMPDNGFGTKLNSTGFLLRVYKVRPNWETKRGGPGTVDILNAVTLRDPDRQVPFAIVNETTPERLLTGGDFDIESMRIARDGTWWFGEEFGPFIVHTDATGKVLDSPTPTPGIFSPDNPYGRTANIARSNGFEGMALSSDGRTLYPILEGAVTGDDPLDRRVLEFDVRARRFTGRMWTYRMSRADTLVSDATVLDRKHLIVLERDNNQGPAAQWKRAFLTHTPGRDAVLDKEQIVDLLALRDRNLISLPARPGDFGLGDPFSFPYVTVEAVLPVSRDRLAFVNDTNFGSTGRNPALPDYSDFIGVEVPGLG
ncbi:MAG: esterase-like activity of phytase family protein [Actinomycetota bacterium]|nr:esterase-like activity of phytase family protein [Actinomycetota bacterium]